MNNLPRTSQLENMVKSIDLRIPINPRLKRSPDSLNGGEMRTQISKVLKVGDLFKDDNIKGLEKERNN